MRDRLEADAVGQLNKGGQLSVELPQVVDKLSYRHVVLALGGRVKVESLPSNAQIRVANVHRPISWLGPSRNQRRVPRYRRATMTSEAPKTPAPATDHEAQQVERAARCHLPTSNSGSPSRMS
jgi:hypothetical protein